MKVSWVMRLPSRRVPAVVVCVRRNELFLISGIRGCYPQFFFVQADGTITYFGNWDKLEAINEASSLPDDILEANPQIMTWGEVFGNME